MQLGISIPQHFADGSFDSRAFRAYMVRAEELGFESAWTQEQVLGANPHLNPIEVMTFAAACTERIRLGCAVFVSSLHSPVHLAKSLSTLDQLSLGRVEVGVGIGGATRMVSAFGVDPEFLVARFIEGVRLMKACWTELLIDFDGRFWQLEGAAMEPKPMQKPHPPMWFGVGHPNGLRRAVQHANGFFGAGSTTTAQFREQVGIVRRELAALEEAKGGFRIAKRVYVVVNDDPVQAQAELIAGLDRIYGSHGVSNLQPVAITGPAEACVTGLQEVIDAGADLVLLNPFSRDLEQMERLAAEVIPHLRELT